MKTRLEAFIRDHNLKPAVLAREAGISRQQLLRLRLGAADARMRTTVRVRDACSRLLLQNVRLSDLFAVERERHDMGPAANAQPRSGGI